MRELTALKGRPRNTHTTKIKGRNEVGRTRRVEVDRRRACSLGTSETKGREMTKEEKAKKCSHAEKHTHSES